MDKETAQLQEVLEHPGHTGVHCSHFSCSCHVAGLLTLDPQPWDSAGHCHLLAGLGSPGIHAKMLGPGASGRRG